MKLYPLLFSEAAKTVQDALKADAALYVYKGEDEVTCVLFSVNRCHEAIESYLENYQGTLDKPAPKAKQSVAEPASVERSSDPRVPPWKSKEEGEEYLRSKGLQEASDPVGAKLDWLAQKLGDRAIIGVIRANSLDTDRGDLWNIGSSAAVQKYGPLIYDISMAAIYPEYIRSDFSLTPASRKVWNVMMTRKDVERKWVGEWGVSQVLTSWDVSDIQGDAKTSGKQLNNFIQKVEDYEIDLNENVFNKMFVEKLSPENKAKLGPFYACRLSPDRTKLVDYNRLLKAGDDIIEELAGTFGSNIKDVEDVLLDAAREHFMRLYGDHG